ncbi:HNH endonuclease [Paenibacillus thermotolerans]|uniref:HNH endonuclease n=1 Tax=Paenibacillus thermotolerans TaxID=3027807 RepID=UPI002368B8CE|nr:MULTISPECIES: HNH endonuclease [unclassified Paenibacillus]
MLFPKPERKVKEKKPYNSLQRKKEKKPLPEYKQNLFAHYQPKASMADRGEFPRKVVAELIAEANGKCQCGCGRPDQSTHHVMPRGRGGRGVKTNGMRLNDLCHDRIQTNEDELQQWINFYALKYGPRFWYDEQDWEEFNRKEAAAKAAEEEQKQRLSELEPIVNLLALAAGRKLKAAEIRLIDGMDEREISTFARLMGDIIGTSVRSNETQFGYGHFND